MILNVDCDNTVGYFMISKGMFKLVERRLSELNVSISVSL